MISQKWVVVQKPFRGVEPYESGDIVDASDWPYQRLQILISQRYCRMATPEEAEAANEAVGKRDVPPTMKRTKPGRRGKG